MRCWTCNKNPLPEGAMHCPDCGAKTDAYFESEEFSRKLDRVGRRADWKVYMFVALCVAGAAAFIAVLKVL